PARPVRGTRPPWRLDRGFVPEREPARRRLRERVACGGSMQCSDGSRCHYPTNLRSHASLPSVHASSLFHGTSTTAPASRNTSHAWTSTSSSPYIRHTARRYASTCGL